MPIICNEFVLLSNWMCNYVSCTALSRYGHFTQHTLTHNSRQRSGKPANDQLDCCVWNKIKSEHCKKSCTVAIYWTFDGVSAIFFCIHTKGERSLTFLSRFSLDFSQIIEFHAIIYPSDKLLRDTCDRARKSKLLIKILCCKFVGAVNNNNANNVYNLHRESKSKSNLFTLEV